MSRFTQRKAERLQRAEIRAGYEEMEAEMASDWNTRPGFDKQNRVRDREGWHFGLISRRDDGSASGTVQGPHRELEFEIAPGQNRHEAAQQVIDADSGA